MKRRAFTLLEVLIVIFVLLILIATYLPSLGSKERPKRSACASNLKQIYTGMYIYGQDYDGAFPLIDLGQGRIIGEDIVVRNRVPLGVDNPYKDIPATEGKSISQNLWLLVRGELAPTEIFTCPSSRERGQKCSMRDYTDQTGGVGPEHFVDFPYEKEGATISYSFVQPWTRFADEKTSQDLWHADADPRLVIGADANNSEQPNYASDSYPVPYDDLEDYINSTNHNDDRSGQNVLYGDGHVCFERSAYVGINNDNIYTAQPERFDGEAGRTPGLLNVRPKNQFDSVLIPNSERDLKNWNHTP